MEARVYEVHNYETGEVIGAIGEALLRRYIEETIGDYVGAVDGDPYGFPGYDIYIDIDEYLETHGTCYAVVDVETNTVVKVHYDLRDAGTPGLVSLMEELTGPGQSWVYVPGGCLLGDELLVDDDGTAIVKEG